MEIDGQITLVYWTDVARRNARRCGINKNGTVKALVASRTPLEDFSGARIIVGYVPAVMLMRKPSECDAVPEWVNKLIRAERAQLFAGPIADATPRLCELCKLCSQNNLEYRHSVDDVYVCSTCTAHWHRACAVRAGLFLGKGYVCVCNRAVALPGLPCQFLIEPLSREDAS